MALTGRFTFRRTMTGKIVLQVEEEVKALFSRSGQLKRRWRDANLMDMAAPEMRALIDLRYKPQFMVQNYYLAPETSLQANEKAAAPESEDAPPSVVEFPNADGRPRRTAH